MATGRWHIQLEEEAGPFSIMPWQPRPASQSDERPHPAPIVALLSALKRLAFRAGEPGGWGTPLSNDPIAFLLDTIGDAVNVWTTTGQLIYSNRAAADLVLDSPAHPGVTFFARGSQRFERRGLAFDGHRTTYVVEVVRELR